MMNRHQLKSITLTSFSVGLPLFQHEVTQQRNITELTAAYFGFYFFPSECFNSVIKLKSLSSVFCLQHPSTRGRTMPCPGLCSRNKAAVGISPLFGCCLLSASASDTGENPGTALTKNLKLCTSSLSSCFTVLAAAWPSRR